MCEACPVMVNHNAPGAIRDDAETLARFNPRHAIEGWLSGYRANGDATNAAICEAALEIQDSWRHA